LKFIVHNKGPSFCFNQFPTSESSLSLINSLARTQSQKEIDGDIPPNTFNEVIPGT